MQQIVFFVVTGWRDLSVCLPPALNPLFLSFTCSFHTNSLLPLLFRLLFAPWMAWPPYPASGSFTSWCKNKQGCGLAAPLCSSGSSTAESPACCSRCSKSRCPHTPASPSSLVQTACSCHWKAGISQTLSLHFFTGCTLKIMLHYCSFSTVLSKTAPRTLCRGNEWSKCGSADGAFNVSVLHKHHSVTKTETCKGSVTFFYCLSLFLFIFLTIWSFLLVQWELLWWGQQSLALQLILPLTRNLLENSGFLQELCILLISS